MNLSIPATLIAILAALQCGACADDPPYANDCTSDPSFRTVQALDDDSLLGFSGADIVAAVNDRGPGSFTWLSGATTQIHVEVTPGTVEVNAPPPNMGYCIPSIRVQDAQIRFWTDDGLLDVAVTAGLVGLGYDGVIDSIFPSDARYELDEAPGLDIPASWSSSERTSEELLFRMQVLVGSQQSPYCLLDESASQDPDDSCSAHDGKVVFYGSDPDADTHSAEDSWFDAALGWWTWM